MTDTGHPAVSAEAGTHLQDAAFNKSFFLIACLVLTIFPILFFPVFYSLEGGAPKTLSKLLSFLLILSTMHVALTLYFYVDKDYRAYIDQHRAFYIYLPIGVVIACGAITLVYGRTGLVYLFIFYHAWLLFHYGRQNWGLMSFVCISQSSAHMGQLERWAFHLAPVGAILGAHSVLPAFKTAFGAYAETSWMLGLAIYCTALLLASAALIRRRHDNLLTHCFFIMMMLFWLPTFLFEQYMTAIMGYAVAHSLQYFVFMSVSASGNRVGAGRGILLLGSGAVVGWVFIWLTRDHELWGPALYFMLGAELGIIMWHFIVDAGLWRLRQPWQRAQVRRRFGFIFPDTSGSR